MTDDDDILAAEYALGLLDHSEAAAVEARFQSDSALSLRVTWWRDQLSPLSEEAAVEPQRDLWPQIRMQLAANDNGALRVTMQRWRAAALGLGAVAATLFAAMMLRPTTPEFVPSAPLVASLSGERGTTVTIAFDAAARKMTVAPATLDPGKGDAELWIIPEGQTVPISMGVIDAHSTVSHALSKEQVILIHAGGTFAISQEPKGGSPTGHATGPVVAAGKIIRI